jgi:hypothetical protein
MAEAPLAGWEELDDGLSPDSSEEDLGDFTIAWLDAEKRFERATINAKLLMRGKDVDIEFTVDRVEVEPKDIIDVNQDLASSDGEVAVFNAELSQKVLSSSDFYELVATPVKVKIVVKPALQTMSLITTAPESIEQTCRVGVKVPPARIRWEDPKRPGLDNPKFEVEADAEDTMELHVWFERWDPKQQKVASDDTVEFSHMTDSQFDAEVFGPHPTSQPWNIAQPGSGNRRFCSLWQSHMVLPAAGRRETLPWDGHIRVRAWRKGAILGRSVNRVRLRPGATPLSQTYVPVRLGPAKIVAKLVEPAEPIPADGQQHDVVLQFVNKKNGRPVDSASVSWELATGARYPGGTVDPTTATIAKGDEGKVRFKYAPPKLTYTPSAAYDQDIRCYAGAGDARRDAEGVVVFVSPEVRAELTATKTGIEVKKPFTLVVPPDQAPDKIVGHTGFVSVEHEVPDRYHVFDALPRITALADGESCAITLDTRTDEAGNYVWRLPELAPGLAKFAEDSARRRRVLEPFKDESPGDFDRVALELLTKYRNRLNSSTSTLSRLLPRESVVTLAKHPNVLARHLSIKPEADYPKCREGTLILEAAIGGTVLVDGLQDYLLKTGLQCLFDFIAALWDALNTFLKLAERALGVLGSMGNTLAPWMLPLLRPPMNAMLSIAERFFPIAAAEMRLAMRQVESGKVPAGDALKAMLDPALQTIRQTLQSAVLRSAAAGKTLLQRIGTSGLIGAAPGKAAEAARDKTIDAITGLLIDMIRDPSSDATHRASKEMLRDMLGLQPMDAAALRVIDGTVRNIDGFAYPGQPGTAKAYLDGLPEILKRLKDADKSQADLKDEWDAVCAAVDLVTNWALFVAVVSALMIPFTAGGTVWVTAGSVAMRVVAMEMVGKLKAVAGLGIVLGRAYLLIGAYTQLLATYEARTLAMTSSSGLAATP